MIPSKPIRKGPGINVSPVGKGSGGSIPKPATKSAAPFGTVDKSVYRRPSAGVTPGGVSVNDNDAGRGTGSVRNGANPGKVHMKNGMYAD